MITSRSLRAHGVAWLTAGLIALALGAGVSAQTPERTAPASPPQASDPPPAATVSPQPPPAATDELQAEEEGLRRRRSYARPAIRIGEDHLVRAGESVREVVVISGSATIDGRVERDVVVVLGSATLGPDASVGGDLVVVSGSPRLHLAPPWVRTSW